MRKGRNLLGRHHQGKRSSTVALVLSILLMLTMVLLVLLMLGIFSLPIGSDDDDSSFYLHDRITVKRKRLLVLGVLDAFSNNFSGSLPPDV
ncbi:hypothetical protein Hanom_Chr16g01508111 [Helianthus anomalus]